MGPGKPLFGRLARPFYRLLVVLRNAFPIVIHKAEVGLGPGILLFGLIQILSWAQIETLMARINAWTDKNSLVLISAWSVNDPSYPRVSHDWEKCGKNSFKKEDGQFRTYLEPDEILTLFHGFEVVHHWEGLGPWHSHGDRPPERHSRVAAVLKR